MVDKYILDTNIFITAKNKVYPFDLFPSFWNQLLDKATNGEFYISEEIFDELVIGDDELSAWIIKNKAEFTILNSDDDELISIYSDVIQSVQDNSQYIESAKFQFADVADSWIIAHAIKNALTIVTLETEADINSRKRVKIPNVCMGFNVHCVDMITFMRNTKFIF